MTKLLLTAAAALALAGAAHAAPSTVDRDTPSKAISTQGVNFADPVQARQFYARLYSAASMVCQSGSADHLVAGTEDLGCLRRNMNEAVRQLGAPQLTAMLNNSYGNQGGANASAFAADAR